MKRFIKSSAAILMAVSLVALATGCGKTESAASNEISTEAISSVTDNNSTEAEIGEQNSLSDSGQTEYPVIITDSKQEEILIESEPARIVSLAPNLTEMLFALDAGDKLVGRTNYCDYPAEALNVESVGDIYPVDIEKIISLNPDLVLISSFLSDEEKKQLTDLGVKVLCLNEETHIEGAQNMLEKLGKAVNRNEESKNLSDEMNQTYSDIKNKVQNKEPLSVYYVVGYGEYGDFTATGDTYVNDIITYAGGINIAAESTGWAFSLEQIVEADPDIIIIGESMKDDFLVSENYKELSAVKNGKVYGIDNSILDRQGVRNADAVEMLAQIFYPDLFE